MTILGDPIRDDPWGAMIANSLLAARRVLRKDTGRLEGFLGYIAKILRSGELPAKPADGPMFGVLRAIGDLKVRGTINEDRQYFLLQQEEGPHIDLFHRSAVAVKDVLRRWIRVAILDGLAIQCQGENPRRKDMVGLSRQVNIIATRSLLNAKKQSYTWDDNKTLQAIGCLTNCCDSQG